MWRIRRGVEKQLDPFFFFCEEGIDHLDEPASHEEITRSSISLHPL